MSKFTFVIEAETIRDAKSQVAELYEELHQTTTVVTQELKPSVAGGQLPKRGKKAKAEAVGDDSVQPAQQVAQSAPTPEPHDEIEDMEPPAAPQPEPVDPFATEETPAAPVEITFQQIMDKGKEVSTKKGLDAARKLVETFGVQKISAIKKVDYQKFMEEAEKVLA